MKGLDELLKALDVFEGKVQNKVIRAATRKAANIIVRQARANVKDISPTIARSISVNVKLYKNTGTVFAIVGPKAFPITKRQREKALMGPKVRFHNPAKTAHLVHGGTAPHTITVKTRLGKPMKKPLVLHHPGTTGTPFLHDAIESHGAIAQQVQVDALREGIEKAGREAGGA